MSKGWRELEKTGNKGGVSKGMGGAATMREGGAVAVGEGAAGGWVLVASIDGSAGRTSGGEGEAMSGSRERRGTVMEGGGLDGGGSKVMGIAEEHGRGVPRRVGAIWKTKVGDGGDVEEVVVFGGWVAMVGLSG